MNYERKRERFELFGLSLQMSKKMKIPVLHSLKSIERQYQTGEEPVLVMCSDMNAYICKYMRSSAASYKLVSELIGAQMARLWRLNSPATAIVNVKAEHWNGLRSTHSTTAPTFGSRKKDGVIDVTQTTIGKIENSLPLFTQLAHIALFDFWLANEDRNANNANLMYDIKQHLFIPIDYGCVFNTATYDYPLSQLTMTDSIVSSVIFERMIPQQKGNLRSLLETLVKDYWINVGICKENVESIIEQIPLEWNLPKNIITNKVNQLFDTKWLNGVWTIFVECISEKVNL